MDKAPRGRGGREKSRQRRGIGAAQEQGARDRRKGQGQGATQGWDAVGKVTEAGPTHQASAGDKGKGDRGVARAPRRSRERGVRRKWRGQCATQEQGARDKGAGQRPRCRIGRRRGTRGQQCVQGLHKSGGQRTRGKRRGQRAKWGQRAGSKAPHRIGGRETS